MSLPIPRDPKLQCQICDIVYDALDYVTKAVIEIPQPDPTVTEAHLLASIVHWWVGNGLEKYGDNTRPLFAMLADALIEHGVDPQKVAEAQRERAMLRVVRKRVH